MIRKHLGKTFIILTTPLSVRYERRNVKLFRYSLLIRLVIYGGPIILAATLWAWAIGVNVWYGFVPGVVLGLLVSIFLDKELTKSYASGGFEAMTGMWFGVVIVGFLLALSIIGAIVGVVLRIL